MLSPERIAPPFSLPAPGAFPPAAKAGPTAIEADRWQERLLVRRYHFPPTGDTEKDLAVRIDYDGTAYWFPLGTADPDAAARKAARIRATVLKQGWPAACRRFSRELIVSFEWCANPLLWTYTTLHTLVAPRAHEDSPAQRGSDARRVIILEKDAGIRRALQWCASRSPQFEVLPCPSPERFLQIFAGQQPALVLLNRSLAERVGFDLSDGLTTLKPGVLALSYSVSVDGDQMFVSTPGGAPGYFLKRVPPSGILEAFLSAGRAANPGREDLLEAAKSLFKDLLRPRAEAGARPLPRLTPRETEVLALLSKGCVDKEIARALGLSVWTVHGHIKKIFERLRVRTRTEAVVRYLEK
ncbi:MAG TPA: response regulator transcription factor [Candidatus Acidoferrales bacterium]|nr:response regulator transcription factor [Candidatus Acidoferrales bacterium]